MKRERRLLGATVFSGTLVLLSHAGGPLSCSAKQVQIRDVSQLLSLAETHRPGVETGLVLTRENSSEEVTIAAGTLIDINGDSDRAVTLVGFHPPSGDVIVTLDGERVTAIPGSHIQSIGVLGERRTGAWASNGALIGGVTGAVAGAAFGASATGSGELAPICAVGVSLPATGIGAAAGAGVGAGVGRERTEYRIGASDFRLGRPSKGSSGGKTP